MTSITVSGVQLVALEITKSIDAFHGLKKKVFGSVSLFCISPCEGQLLSDSLTTGNAP